jgi:replication factor C small subunit
MSISSLWVEKYRPKKLADVCDHKEIIKILSGFVENKTLTHSLFGGPPGVGKTTTALCIAYELFGEKNFRYNFAEMNASDKRGIDEVRYNIKTFASTSPYGGAPFKIMFLDEVDAMTQDAQWALRRIIEQNEKQCRFILSCNYLSRVIPALQSRCTPFRFKAIPKEDAIERLKFIAQSEGFNPPRSVLEMIYDNSNGDMRYMINVLQCAALRGAITDETVKAVMALVEPALVEKMMVLAMSGRFLEARKVLHTLLFKEAYYGRDVVKAIFNYLSVDENSNVDLLIKLAEIDRAIASGADDMLQLSAFLAYCGKEVVKDVVDRKVSSAEFTGSSGQ